MNKNKEMLQKIIELQNTNPDAEIVFCVDGDTICYDYPSTIQSITSIELDELYITSDGTHFSGEEDVIDHFQCYEDGDDKIAELVKESHQGMAIFVRLSA